MTLTQKISMVSKKVNINKLYKFYENEYKIQKTYSLDSYNSVSRRILGILDTYVEVHTYIIVSRRGVTATLQVQGVRAICLFLQTTPPLFLF